MLNEKYQGEKTEGFFIDLKRLASGEPLGYVIGHVPFLGCVIHLDSQPLIPRPETEFWTLKAIETMKEAVGSADRPLRILDLCAGSGAIGIAVAKHMPQSLVDFAEMDQQHTATIERNIKENNIDSSRVRIIAGDLFENITDQYDFILTNPPYIDPSLDRTEQNVKNFEPHLALYGGTDGMELIARIIAEAPQHLSPSGQLWIEHEPEQSEMISKLADIHFKAVQTLLDQYDMERYSVLKI